jgi:isoleucyl-tRNA synthetase
MSGSLDFSALELRVLERWQRNRTFERSLERREGAPVFTFYDGPPFATGTPHYGHILTSFIKDVVPRYQTMRGFHVPRRWGWDCHGLPVELEVEKALGLKSASQLPLAEFNAACKQLVMRYAQEWRDVVTRLGRWVDFDGAYKTMDADYTEKVLWVWKTLHERGLVYEGHKVVPYCTRCRTPLSNFEAKVDDAYRDRDDLAVTVKLRLVEDPRQSVLAWTTTPWTLPANAAAAVHPELVYARWERDGESVWLATSARERYAKQLAGFVEREQRFGRELVGLQYTPVLPYLPGAHRVLAADWVSAADGTGVVHLAPAFGEDDAETCAAAGVTAENPVKDDGTFDDRVVDFAGMHVFEANAGVVDALVRAGLAFDRGTVRHAYPHCWRCDTPLVYRAVPSWFVAVTKLRERLVANNARIHWVPEHVGTKRFADWLANARDWSVSRDRFWGAPVPVWRCTSCSATVHVGGRAELEQLSGMTVTDWHRPAVDEVRWRCHCGGTMQRVAQVLDCWFESGAMPYAMEQFPGDFVCEYVAQTRGWFYTMLVLSTALFDEPPFHHAVCHGVLLGHDRRKMSKRLRNYPDPTELVAEHGSDALRGALLMSGAVAGSDIAFSAATVRDFVRRVHLPLWNSLHLVTEYAAVDGFVASDAPVTFGKLDRALLAETEALRDTVERAMAVYDVTGAYVALEDFVTTLSTWYLRTMKASLWRHGLDDQKRATYTALVASLRQLARVAAPFLPFLADALHEELGGTDSVHLEDWPAPRDDWRDDTLVGEMQRLRLVVQLARRVREQHRVKHRQPLRVARVAGVPRELLVDYRELLLAELNVKDVVVDAALGAASVTLDFAKLGKRLRGKLKQVTEAVRLGAFVERDGRLDVAGETLEPDEFTRHGDVAVDLDLAVDDELAREGVAREVNRAVQDLRKQAQLAYGDRVCVGISGTSAAVDAMLAEHGAWLVEQCGATSVVRDELPDPAVMAQLEVDGVTLNVALSRV